MSSNGKVRFFFSLSSIFLNEDNDKVRTIITKYQKSSKLAAATMESPRFIWCLVPRGNSCLKNKDDQTIPHIEVENKI